MHVQVSFLKWELGETMLAVSWQLMIPILSCTRKTGIVDDPSLEKKNVQIVVRRSIWMG